jgi:hypothetical protein
MEDNVETHTLFFKIMTPKKLNELLLRASGDNSILQRDINARLKGLNVGYAYVNIAKEIEDGDEICSLYINFKKQHNKFGHITFHFDKKRNNKYKNVEDGRFHAKNNRNNTRKYALRIQKNSNNSFITMRLSDYAKGVLPDFKQCIDKSLEVLNEYFNPKTAVYLGIHNPDIPLHVHACLSRITKVFKSNSGSLQQTRKNPLSVYTILSTQRPPSSQASRKSPWGKVREDIGKSVDNTSK